MKNLILCVLVVFGAIGCSPKPRPILYGTDSCHYCRMTIVDHQHAAEAVTSKGKAYKFDAVECMINHVKQNEATYAFILVNDYLSPGNLIDAKASTFLISPEIPSPMGAFLSAFKDRQSAEATRQSKGGELYDWEQVKQKFN